MHRSGRVTFIGVAGLILGTSCLAQDVRAITAPWLLIATENMFQHAASEAAGPRDQATNPADIFVPPELHLPEWFTKWSVASGVAGVLCSGVTLLGSVWLLALKRHAMLVAACGTVGSVLVNAARVLVFVWALGFMGVGLAAGGAMAGVLGLVFLGILLAVGRHAVTSAPLAVEPPVVR